MLGVGHVACIRALGVIDGWEEAAGAEQPPHGVASTTGGVATRGRFGRGAINGPARGDK